MDRRRSPRLSASKQRMRLITAREHPWAPSSNCRFGPTSVPRDLMNGRCIWQVAERVGWIRWPSWVMPFASNARPRRSSRPFVGRWSATSRPSHAFSVGHSCVCLAPMRTFPFARGGSGQLRGRMLSGLAGGSASSVFSRRRCRTWSKTLTATHLNSESHPQTSVKRDLSIGTGLSTNHCAVDIRVGSAGRSLIRCLDGDICPL